MAFKALKGIKPINPIGRILGHTWPQKDSRSKNMTIEPEKFNKKFNKLQYGHGTGADMEKLADNLDDEQLSDINRAYEKKAEADKVLKPFGLSGNPEHHNTWVYWRTKDVEDERKEGKRKEKNPRK